MEPIADTSDADVTEIVRGFEAVQVRSALEENRDLRPGTHAKGVCARAVFEVFDVRSAHTPQLGERLARGLYARPGTYPATVRFANSDPRVSSDWDPDVRGFSFSLDLAGAGFRQGVQEVVRQDFSLQSAPTLPFNDVRAFVVFAKVSAAPNEAVALGSLPFADQQEYARTSGAVMEQKRQPVRPYQQLRYWSNVPFRHGSEDIVKYTAIPAPLNPARPLDRANRNALRDDLVRHLDEDTLMSSFDFGLQFLDVERMTYQGKRQDADFWIENASIEWPEEQAPFHSVGRLTLLPRSLLSTEASAAVYFDVTEHSTPEQAPVGSVNRARWFAESASRKLRMGKG